MFKGKIVRSIGRFNASRKDYISKKEPLEVISINKQGIMKCRIIRNNIEVLVALRYTDACMNGLFYKTTVII